MMDSTKLKIDQLVFSSGAVIIRHRGGEKGRYFGGGLISIRSGLGPTAYLCTLAHELAHHVLGHDPAATGWWKARQEKQADEYAAGMLIDREEYKMAEKIHGPYPSAIAAELGVTKYLLGVWQRLERQSQ